MGVATKLRTGRSGVRIPVGNFSLFQNTPTGSGANPALLFSGYRRSFPGLKLPRREVDYSPPSSVEIKNEQDFGIGKKAIPLQAWTGPEGSRRLRLPDF